MCRIQISFGHAETMTISVFIRWFINYSKQNVTKKYMYTVERRYMELGYFKFPVFLNSDHFPFDIRSQLFTVSCLEFLPSRTIFRFPLSLLKVRDRRFTIVYVKKEKVTGLMKFAMYTFGYLKSHVIAFFKELGYTVHALSAQCIHYIYIQSEVSSVGTCSRLPTGNLILTELLFIITSYM